MSDITISDFYCVFCGKKGIPIPRKNGQAREGGHLKKMYCLNCKRETNMAEIKGYGFYTKTFFDKERKFNNFDKEGNRILEIGQFKSKLNALGEL